MPTWAPLKALQVMFACCGSPPDLQTWLQRRNCRKGSVLWSIVFASGTVEEKLLTDELYKRRKPAFSPWNMQYSAPLPPDSNQAYQAAKQFQPQK